MTYTINNWLKEYFEPARMDMIKRLRLHLEHVWMKHGSVATECFNEALVTYEEAKLALLDLFVEMIEDRMVHVSLFEQYFLFDMVHRNQ